MLCTDFAHNVRQLLPMAVTNTNGSHTDVRCIFSPETSPAGAANAHDGFAVWMESGRQVAHGLSVYVVRIVHFEIHILN